ncbi:MAG: hypothetical protein KBS68_02475 [Clostridiales bacterium]|nr:hypothetical protein [Candidatus Crickella merdequi]
MKKIQINDVPSNKTEYETPHVVEIPVSLEGILCDSNEHVGETDGEW